MDVASLSTHPIVVAVVVAAILGGARLGMRVLGEIRELAEGQRRMDSDLRRHMTNEEQDRRRVAAELERTRVDVRADQSAIWSALTALRDEVTHLATRAEAIDVRTERIEQATARTAEWAEHHVTEASRRDERLGRHDERLTRIEADR